MKKQPEPQLAPGTYRLTRNIPALKPDRRKRHDWRADDVPAGALFVVDHFLSHPDDDSKGPLRVFKASGYSHCDVPARDFPIDALEPVEETPSQWLNREWHGFDRVGQRILDILVAEGTITLEQVKEAANRKEKS